VRARAPSVGCVTSTLTSARHRPGPGDLLRGWRTRRRRSQMDLALSAGVSTRHLSFVETGRARASRELLVDLCEHLEVPLRERNTLLLAAGFAPLYTESRLDAGDLGAVRTALEHLLAGHEPFPALVVDRCGDVVMANRAVGAVLSVLDPAALAPPLNIYRLSLLPDGLAPHVRNLPEWAGHLTHRLERLGDLTGDPRIAALLEELAPHVPPAPPEGSRTAEVMLPLHLAHPAGDLRFYSTITHFGAAWDVTLDELSLESFVPADDATRAALQGLLGAS
jgi:transcriptional regulator with XRE-family HTH domain